MNIHRFLSLPNAFKPAIWIITFLIILISLFTHVKPKEHATFGWFFWITIILQLVFMSGVCVLFLFEMEALLTCGRDDQWPLAEMIYSGVIGIINIINMFVVANWNRVAESGGFIVSALLIFALVILYGFSGVMMFRIWKGFVKSGASQNPTGNVQPGNTGQMHPGI